MLAEESGGRIMGRPEDILNVVLLVLRQLLFGKQLTVADDGRQGVVEVVGDAAGHFTDRFQLLHLDDLALYGAKLIKCRLELSKQARAGERQCQCCEPPRCRSKPV